MTKKMWVGLILPKRIEAEIYPVLDIIAMILISFHAGNTGLTAKTTLPGAEVMSNDKGLL